MSGKRGPSWAMLGPVSYTHLFDRKPETSGVLSLATESGSGFVVFSPLAQGLLTGRYLNGIPQLSLIHI